MAMGDAPYHTVKRKASIPAVIRDHGVIYAVIYCLYNTLFNFLTIFCHAVFDRFSFSESLIGG